MRVLCQVFFITLQESETVASTSGSTKHVALAAAEAEQAAQEAFAPILERQAEADAVKQKLVLLQRFEALFRMPGRVRELAVERDYQGVVTEYSKGKKLIPVQDHALWKEVAKRLEHETAQVCVCSLSLLQVMVPDQIQHWWCLQAVLHISRCGFAG